METPEIINRSLVFIAVTNKSPIPGTAKTFSTTKEPVKRLAANGVPNKEYQQIVKQVNEILAPHYDIATKHVATSELTEEELDKLYQSF